MITDSDVTFPAMMPVQQENHFDGAKPVIGRRQTQSIADALPTEIQAQTRTPPRRKGAFVRILIRLLHGLQEARQREAESEVAVYRDPKDCSDFGERPGVNRPHTDAWVVVLFITFLSSAVAWPLAAQARDNGQLPAVPNNVRTWYKGLTQPDNPITSCCGEADAFEADSFEVVGDHYVAIITNGRGDFPTGARILVPNNKMKWDSGNPTGHGIIFIGSDAHVLCYVTPGGI